MFTVYVLYSEKYDKLYIGDTSDLKKRLLSHNEFAMKGLDYKISSMAIDIFRRINR